MRQLQWDNAQCQVEKRLLNRSRINLQKAALVSKVKPVGIDPGYVVVEIGDLVMHFAKKNHGLELDLADAVGELARTKFLELVGG